MKLKIHRQNHIFLHIIYDTANVTDNDFESTMFLEYIKNFRYNDT